MLIVPLNQYVKITYNFEDWKWSRMTTTFKGCFQILCWSQKKTLGGSEKCIIEFIVIKYWLKIYQILHGIHQKQRHRDQESFFQNELGHNKAQCALVGTLIFELCAVCRVKRACSRPMHCTVVVSHRSVGLNWLSVHWLKYAAAHRPYKDLPSF